MSQGQSYPINFLRRPDNFDADPFVNNLSANNPSYPYSSIFTALFIALGFNVRTKAATDYYVDPSGGNDANTGAIGSPWRTFAHAMAVILLLDFAGQAVTLHLVNNATEELFISPWTGGGSFVFDGGGKTLTVVCTTSVGNCIALSGDLPNSVTIQNVTLSTTGSADPNHLTGNCIFHAGVGRVVIGASVTFGACVGDHMLGTEAGSKFSGTVGYSITGAGGFAHIQLFAYAQAILWGSITVSGGLTWTGAFAFIVGAYDCSSATFSTNVATCTRFTALLNGIIVANDTAQTKLPGNVVGSHPLGGQYL